MPALGHAALWSRRLAAVALFLSAGRFAWTATAWAFDRDAASSRAKEVDRVHRERASAAADDAPGNGAAEDTPRPAQPENQQEPTGKQPPEKELAAPEVRTLFVDLGPARSDVYVNGVRVGQTPYAGTWSCRRDDEVTIHVLPKRAAPIESRAACRDSMRAVAGRNLDPDEVAALLADPTLPSSVKNALRR